MIVQQGTEEVRLRLTLLCRDQEEEARLYAEQFVSRFLNKSQAREGTTRQFSGSQYSRCKYFEIRSLQAYWRRIRDSRGRMN